MIVYHNNNNKIDEELKTQHTRHEKIKHVSFTMILFLVLAPLVDYL